LNTLRHEYIERARGLGLSVFFNTTIFDGNFEDIPHIVGFFIRNSDIVRMASFQLQADTGRGVLGMRPSRITIESATRKINAGAGAALSFDAIQIGHSHCNRCAMALVTNNKAYDMLDDRQLVTDVLEHTSHLRFDRHSRSAVTRIFAMSLLTSPRLLGRALVWAIRKAWLAKNDLVAARGRVDKLSFFIHNFMDACALERDRIDACTFTTVTSDGPISMCLHNAKRDAFILQPVRLRGSTGERLWNPLSGEIEASRACRIGETVKHSPKTAKGRLKGLYANRRSTPA